MPISNYPRLKFSDLERVPVHTGSISPGADAVQAETTGTFSSALPVSGVKQIDIFLETVAVVGATKLFVKVRFSGEKAPAIGTLGDWAFIKTDNIDGATGISTVQDYMVEIDLLSVNGAAYGPAARQHLLRIENISGKHVSLLMWIDGGALTANVFMLRQGGSM